MFKHRNTSVPDPITKHVVEPSIDDVSVLEVYPHPTVQTPQSPFQQPPFSQPTEAPSQTDFPHPGHPSIPYFDGRNVTRFLRRWNLICCQHWLEGNHPLRYELLVDYISPDLDEFSRFGIECRIKYSAGYGYDWEAFWNAMRTEFKEGDVEQTRVSLGFLRSLVDSTDFSMAQNYIPADLSTKIRAYTLMFKSISAELIRNQEAAPFHFTDLYLEAFSGELSDELKRVSSNMDVHTPAGLTSLFDYVIAKCESE